MKINMASKRKNLYLYLTLACFIGLIAIFVVDGYLGVYDTLYVTAQEYEQKIDYDFWQQDYPWSTYANWGEKVFFRYDVDNRQFSAYSANVDVSVWRAQEKVLDVLSQPMVIGAFSRAELEWTLDTNELLPTISPDQYYEFTVVITRGDIERRIIVSVNPTIKPVPVPVPAPVR